MSLLLPSLPPSPSPLSLSLSLQSTGGGSMGTDLALRVHCSHGDYAIVEEPTYFLSHTMMRDRGMTNLLGVPMQSDGLDLDAVRGSAHVCVCV